MVSGILFSLLVIIVLLSISREARSQRLGLNCNNDYNPNGNSPFRGNLNFLLSSTLPNASQTKDFYNSTAGLNTSAPAYGLYMCRGDVNSDLCHSCVQNSSREILNVCLNQTLASIWYDYCMLRYSNHSIFSVLDRSSIWPSCNPQNITARELDGFNQALGKMMDEITTRAANSRSGKKFAVQEGNFSPFAKLFTLVQCTPDLSTEDCDTCLRDAISRIPIYCYGKQGGRVLFPSCNIRYEIYKFYNISDAPTPAPPPNCNPTAPPSTSTPAITSGKG